MPIDHHKVGSYATVLAVTVAVLAWLFPFRAFRESPLASLFLKPGEVVSSITETLPPPISPVGNRAEQTKPAQTTATTPLTATEALAEALVSPTKAETRQPRQKVQVAEEDNFAARYLNASTTSGDSSAWTVATLSDQSDFDDLSTAIGSALMARGKEVTSPFRNVQAQQSIASELFRGDRSILSRLRLSRFCSHIVVGRLTTTPFGSIEGLFVVRASLSIRVLTCEGEFVRQFEVVEKGGGLNQDAGRQRAIDEVKASLPNRIASEIN